MAQIRHTYQIQNGDNNSIVNQLNQILNLLCERIDRIEGFRGVPKFYNYIDMNDNRITNVAEAVEQDDAVVLSQVDGWKTIDCPFGTNPVADVNDDTLTLDSASGRITITGDSATDTVDFDLDPTQHDHAQLVDGNNNVTIKSKDDTAGASNYVSVQAGQSGFAPTVSVEGTDSSIGLLFSAKGDEKYVQLWGGSGQYKGARFVLYGRDHATTPGKAYLDFGGYDATGQIIFRHRLTSSFLTVFTMNYDGKVTLIEDVNTSAGKRYLVNGAQHRHTEDDFDFTEPLTIDKLICHIDDFVFLDGLPVLLA